jgi:hypothetical protein
MDLRTKSRVTTGTPVRERITAARSGALLCLLNLPDTLLTIKSQEADECKAREMPGAIYLRPLVFAINSRNSGFGLSADAHG